MQFLKQIVFQNYERITYPFKFKKVYLAAYFRFHSHCVLHFQILLTSRMEVMKQHTWVSWYSWPYLNEGVLGIYDKDMKVMLCLTFGHRGLDNFRSTLNLQTSGWTFLMSDCSHWKQCFLKYLFLKQLFCFDTASFKSWDIKSHREPFLPALQHVVNMK